MSRVPFILVPLLACAAQAWPNDANDVRAAIERHYKAINAQEEGKSLSGHLETFTMSGDGELLFEPDWVQVQERVSQDAPLPELNEEAHHHLGHLYPVGATRYGSAEAAGSESTPDHDWFVWFETASSDSNDTMWEEFGKRLREEHPADPRPWLYCEELTTVSYGS